MNRIFLKECFLQKTNQYEALEVLSEKDKNKLELGSPLSLCIDEDIDKEKKLVFAKTKDNGEKIGVLSEEGPI